MRRCLVAVCTLLCMLVPLNAHASTPSGAAYELDAVVPLTGPSAFLGRSYLETFRALESVVNGSGGIAGRPLRIVALDSQSSAQVGVQLVNELVAKHVAVVIEGDTANVLNAQAPLVTSAGPVLYSLSPLVYPPTGSYIFSAGASGTALTSVGIRYFRERNWTRIAMISSTDASGADFEKQTLRALAQPASKSMQLVANEHFNPTDISVTAQITRIKAANPQAIFVWTTGTAVATVFRAINDAGMNAPVASSQGNLVYEQLTSYNGFVPKELYFPTVLSLVPGAAKRGPLHDAQATYVKALTAVGVRPDLAHNLPWDPTMIIVDALRHLGPDASADHVRDFILHLHGWVGINGVYDLAAGDQRGIVENAAAVVRWNSKTNDWTQASLPGGFLPTTK